MSLAPGPAVFGVVKGSGGCFSHQDLQAQGPRQPLRTLPTGAHPPQGLHPALTHWPPPQQLLACFLACFGSGVAPQVSRREVRRPLPAPPFPQMLLWPQAAIKGIDLQAFSQVKPSRRKIHVSG